MKATVFSIAKLKPARRKDELICEEVSGECVIYDQRQKKAHLLNSTLTWIWRRCDGNTSVEALSKSFAEQFDARNPLEIMSSGLNQLDSRQLLETPINLPEEAGGKISLARRRAIVVGGAVLMPAIVSILAPTPMAAISNNTG